jgi:hypothetical protein
LTETHQVTENVTENKFTETVTETVNFHRKRHPYIQEIRKAHRKIPSVCLIKVLFLRILHVSANGKYFTETTTFSVKIGALFGFPRLQCCYSQSLRVFLSTRSGSARRI